MTQFWLTAPSPGKTIAISLHMLCLRFVVGISSGYVPVSLGLIRSNRGTLESVLFSIDGKENIHCPWGLIKNCTEPFCMFPIWVHTTYRGHSQSEYYLPTIRLALFQALAAPAVMLFRHPVPKVDAF